MHACIIDKQLAILPEWSRQVKSNNDPLKLNCLCYHRTSISQRASVFNIIDCTFMVGSKMVYSDIAKHLLSNQTEYPKTKAELMHIWRLAYTLVTIVFRVCAYRRNVTFECSIAIQTDLNQSNLVYQLNSTQALIA